MSTKIFNGRILCNSTLETALGKLKQMRCECLKSMTIAMAAQIAQRMALINDLRENYLRIDRKDQHTFATVLDEFHEAERTVKGHGTRDVNWDATFDICLIPSGNHMLALSYFERDEGYSALLDNYGFEDYHYQNSTDKPCDLSDLEWDERRDAWDSAIPRLRAPSSVGLSYSVINWEDIGMVFFNADAVRATQPTDDKRRRQVAMRLSEIEYRRDPELPLMEAFDQIVELSKLRAPMVLLAKSAI